MKDHKGRPMTYWGGKEDEKDEAKHSPVGSGVIKPCPFCGKAAKIFQFESDDKRCCIDCGDRSGNCGCGLDKWFDTREEAIEAWNKRAL